MRLNVYSHGELRCVRVDGAGWCSVARRSGEKVCVARRCIYFGEYVWVMSEVSHFCRLLACVCVVRATTTRRTS